VGNRTEKNKNSDEDYGMESHRNEIQRTFKNRWTVEVLNDLKKLKVNNLIYLVKDRKSSYKLVRMTKNPQGNTVSEEEEEEGGGGGEEGGGGGGGEEEEEGEEEDNGDDYNGDYYVEFLHYS
jgi:hypothetical protein